MPRRRTPFSLGAWRFAVPALLAAAAAGCTLFGPEPHRPVPWPALPGWDQADPLGAWPALLNSCERLAPRAAVWRDICEEAAALAPRDQATARAFFERRFEPWPQRDGVEHEGLITGYYEPFLHGSWTRTERYRYPLYQPPDDLLTVDLGRLYPELQNRTLRGRLVGQRVVPYFSRAQIDDQGSPLAGNELLWVDDPVALFFLQVQGSGRVRLPSGETVAVGYADQNGHPYTAIGRTLVQHAGFELEDVDMPAIRAWLEANPDQAQAVMNTNASYIFFELRDAAAPGPLGTLGVPLFPERAIAVDPAHVPLGVPVWLDTVLPDADAPYRRLVFAQDTGGAINGPLRADLFFGQGARAEYYAGRMKAPGRLYVLRPRVGSPTAERHDNAPGESQAAR